MMQEIFSVTDKDVCLLANRFQDSKVLSAKVTYCANKIDYRLVLGALAYVAISAIVLYALIHFGGVDAFFPGIGAWTGGTIGIAFIERAISSKKQSYIETKEPPPPRIKRRIATEQPIPQPVFNEMDLYDPESQVHVGNAVVNATTAADHHVESEQDAAHVKVEREPNIEPHEDDHQQGPALHNVAEELRAEDHAVEPQQDASPAEPTAEDHAVEPQQDASPDNSAREPVGLVVTPPPTGAQTLEPLASLQVPVPMSRSSTPEERTPSSSRLSPPPSIATDSSEEGSDDDVEERVEARDEEDLVVIQVAQKALPLVETATSSSSTQSSALASQRRLVEQAKQAAIEAELKATPKTKMLETLTRHEENLGMLFCNLLKMCAKDGVTLQSWEQDEEGICVATFNREYKRIVGLNRLNFPIVYIQAEVVRFRLLKKDKGIEILTDEDGKSGLQVFLKAPKIHKNVYLSLGSLNFTREKDNATYANGTVYLDYKNWNAAARAIIGGLASILDMQVDKKNCILTGGFQKTLDELLEVFFNGSRKVDADFNETEYVKNYRKKKKK